MTSNRGRRDVERENRDSYGDQHFPGTGTAKRGGNHNAAVESGGGGGNGYVYDWVETWPSSSGYNGPRIVLAPAISGTAFEGDTLTLAVEPLWDGNQTTSSWVWLKNNVAVPGSLNQTTLVTTGVTPGDIWHVAATASNEEGGRTVTSNGILTLLEAPDITIPEQVFSAGQSLPHQLNFNDFNVGGAASAVAVNYGSVVGTTVTFPDTPISRFVDWSATNTTGVDTGTFQLTINTPVVSVVSPIPDQSFLLGDTAVTFDLRTVFTNADEYSVVGPNSSILGDGYTLQVTASNLWTNAPVTVTGANAYNSLNDVFNLTVAAVAITAVQTPATSVLVVGQSLDDTTNWATFLNIANYSSNAGSIVSAVPDFTDASVPDATTAFADLDTNRFSVAVTDASGNVRTFDTSPRTVVHVAPIAGALAPVNETQGSGTPTVALAAGFTGQALVYTSNQAWATVSESTLTIADEVRADTVRITATNSGGSAFVDLSVTITANTTNNVVVGPDNVVVGGDNVVVSAA